MFSLFSEKFSPFPVFKLNRSRLEPVNVSLFLSYLSKIFVRNEHCKRRLIDFKLTKKNYDVAYQFVQ